MNKCLTFLPDGRDRHEQAHVLIAEQIEAEVMAEYAEQLATATVWQRLRLRRLIRQEVARRLPEPPSPRNLYGRCQ